MSPLSWTETITQKLTFFVVSKMSTAEMSASVAGRDWLVSVDVPASFLSSPQTLGVNEYEPHVGGRCNYAVELENLDKVMLKVQLYLKDIYELNNTVVCIVGDYEEMLGDGTVAGQYKCPACLFRARHCERNRTHRPGNNSLSWWNIHGPGGNEGERPLLMGGKPTSDNVSSGLDNWRLVVQQIEGVTYTLVCCRGPRAEPNSSTTASSSEKD